MEEVDFYNIPKKKFKGLGRLAGAIYNTAIVIAHFCETQPEIEELYNLTPVVKNLRNDADVLNAFFISQDKDPDFI